jgi:hypothetical protein
MFECQKCHKKASEEQARAEKWTILQQASQPQGILWVMCRDCLVVGLKTEPSGSLATMDVKMDAPVRRKRGNNAKK